ncbi:MAG: hypothetical protein DMD33_00870 [Gemmatimonadetes bacterium]|nr:MAG: hypothetical protein DMD33_00870 [Gemmatimonadota bacterium]
MPLAIGGLLGRFTERTASETLGFGVGVALAEALRPEATALGQEAWRAAPTKVVDAELAAAIVAEAVEMLPWGENEAAGEGIDGERFLAMVGEALNAPAVGELLRMRRRGTINPAAFAHGLRKAKLEERWDEALAELQNDRLDPAVIATAVQRGLLPNEGILPVGPPSAVCRVEPMPAVELDPFAEAAAAGINADRLKVLARIVGLPPAHGELAQLLNRGAILEADYFRGIAEGNTRNEWAEVLLALRRRILTPHEYVEGRLRGWIDDQAMHAGAALSGMEEADADLLAKITGRPISFRQVFIGLTRLPGRSATATRPPSCCAASQPRASSQRPSPRRSCSFRAGSPGSPRRSRPAGPARPKAQAKPRRKRSSQTTTKAAGSPRPNTERRSTCSTTEGTLRTCSSTWATPAA